MVLSNCKFCNKVFNKTVSDECPDCIKKRNDALAKIDNYSFGKKEINIGELAKYTKLDEEYIKQLLCEGKIKSIRKLIAVCEMCEQFTYVSTVNFLCQNCVTELKSVKSNRDDGLIPQTSDKPKFVSTKKQIRMRTKMDENK